MFSSNTHVAFVSLCAIDLNHSTCQDGQLFQEYSDLISLDFGTPVQTQSELACLWEQVAEVYRKKGGLVKSGRWFSWHSCCEEQLKEFWTTRMLLMHEKPNGQPDSAKDFLRLRSEFGGGTGLALQCCSWTCWMGIQVLRIGGRPLWNFYTETVTSIKSPQQNVVRLMELCDRWHRSRQFLELAGVLKDWDEFSKVLKYHSLARRHLDEEAHKELLDSFVFMMFYYILTLFCKRASSMSKFTSPPEIYSKILSSDEEEAEMTLANILSDWRTLLLLEQSKYQELASDLNLTVSKPMRLAFTFFEAGKTDAAIEIMKSMLLVVPDTKLIEDIHQKVRVDSKANANLNQSCAEIQNIIMNSGLLEARGIPHTAKINRETFLARWKTTPGNKKFKQVFHASSYKLAREFGSILAPRVWPSLSEEALARSSAGWAWIRKHQSMNLKAAGILLTESEFDYI